MEIIENNKGGSYVLADICISSNEKVDIECCCARDSLSVVSETGYVNET